MKLFLPLLILLSGFLPMPAQAASPGAPWPKHEVRAVWLTTIGGIDWPHSYANNGHGVERQKAELTHLLDMYQRAGINTILLQTRIRGTLLYSSELEPFDGCLSGTPGTSPGYDALQFAIDEAHRRGMELHAWVVTIPVGKVTGAGYKTLRRRRPQLLRRIGQEAYLNPEDPRTGDYLATICEEITRRYDIDGIHLDYIRYPENWKIKVSRDQGRRNITAIATTIAQRVKALKPWVKMSCAPIGKHDDLSRYWAHGWNARTTVCQDAQQWLRTGVMDQLYPMMYFRDNNFYPFALDWAENQYGGQAVPGLGIYFLEPRAGRWQLAHVTRELEVLRQIGVGQCYFRGKFLTDNIKGIYDFVCRHNRYPALVPPMRVPDGADSVAQPTQLSISAEGMSWQGDAPFYNIYSSRSWPVDTRDARNLVAVRRADKQITCDTRGRYFAVTATDRYGRESEAQQSHNLGSRGNMAARMWADGGNPGQAQDDNESRRRWDVPFLSYDGQRLQLPEALRDIDAGVLAIETLQGVLVATRTYGPGARTVSVAGLPPGDYVLRSLGRKGVTHRLGVFRVKPGK